MSSEIIVVLVLVALAIIGIVYLELHSRRNQKQENVRGESEKKD